jgi:hypothetical protein
MAPKFAPLVAVPAMLLALVSVYLPALLGAVVVACIVAHVAASFRATADDARTASWSDVDALDFAPLAPISVARPFRAIVASRYVARRPFVACSAAMPVDVDGVTTSAAPIVENVSTPSVESTVSPSIPALPSSSHLVRLAFDCQQSARDAAIKCRVACVMGDADTAEKWANLACALTWKAREYRDATNGDRHAIAYVRGCVEALSIACDAIDKRWPVEAPRVTSALMLAIVPRIVPWSPCRVGSSTSVDSRDVASPARMVTVTRILPPVHVPLALPVRASRAKRSTRKPSHASA